MLLFTWSVYMATFGQDVFGRDQIDEMAQNFAPAVTKHSELLAQETVKLIVEQGLRSKNS